MKIKTATLLATLACSSVLQAQAPDSDPESPTTHSMRNIDLIEVLEGDGAPGRDLISEAILVEITPVDPDAMIAPGAKPNELFIHATPAGHAKVEALIDLMSERDPAQRITPEMLYLDVQPSRDGIGRFFFGREIAKVMGHLGANWLERPSREKEERTSLLIDLLEIDEGMDVADIGAGTGYFSFPIARRLGDGTVHAVDIQPEMLEFIEARKRHEDITNVKGVLGTITDTGLAADSIDLAFAVDAYHEFSNPWEMLQSIRKALRPGGRLVLVEFRLEDPEVPIKLLHKMSQEQVRRELEAAGYQWVKTEDALPRQHVLVFRKPGKDESSSPPAKDT